MSNIATDLAHLDDHHEAHDWHSSAYVDEWIQEDISDDARREGVLRDMVGLARFDVNEPLRVLDVGGGYGILSEALLKAYPRAHVTLLDFSLPMIKRARTRLENHSHRVTYLLADLSDSGWTHNFAQGFDLAISAFAIHNLETPQAVAKAFKDVACVLRPDRGVFLNYDFVQFAGGLEKHLQYLRDAGFDAHATTELDAQAPVMIATL